MKSYDITPDRAHEASAVLAKCWKHTHRGIVNGEYLDSLKDDYRVDFLETRLTDKSVNCTVFEEDGVIGGVSFYVKHGFAKAFEEKIAMGEQTLPYILMRKEFE